MDTKKKVCFGSVFRNLIKFVFICLVVLVAVISIIDLEHYNRAYKNPLTVTAVVTSHTTDTHYFDSDDWTTYYSYVSYTVNDTVYSNQLYEENGEESYLTPIGSEVQLQVSSENPAIQLSKLKNDGSFLLAVSLSILAAGLAKVWCSILTNMRQGNLLLGIPDEKTIQKDVKLTIWGRFRFPFCLLNTLFYIICFLRYPLSFSSWIVIGCVTFMALVWYSVMAIQDSVAINRGEYELRKGSLISKKMDDDDNKLIYRYGNNKWETTVSSSFYEQSKIGDTVLSVYLSRREKYVLQYNISSKKEEQFSIPTTKS